MARPQRCRRICEEPEFSEFCPKEATDTGKVVLSVDEFEVIRLVDYEKKTHEQCAKQMDISRTTVTEIYENARWKIADSIINGRHLIIAGGTYRICDGSTNVTCGDKCKRSSKNEDDKEIIHLEKGGNIMRIAVTYENGQIFQHFGHTEQFKIYDVEDGQIKTEQVIDTNGSGHGALAGFLMENQVDTLICGGIGGGAQVALAQAGIQLYGGTSGSADEAVKALLQDNLQYNPDVKCDHHDHEHGEGHTCGDHGCGSHSCGNHE